MNLTPGIEQQIREELRPIVRKLEDAALILGGIIAIIVIIIIK